MNFLLSIGESDYSSVIIKDKGLIETLLFGSQILLIGMATIFSVLILLWLCVSLFNLFSGNASKNTDAVPAPVIEVAPKASAANANDEIVAVIAAAIACAEAEGNGSKFRVVSFRRK